MPGPAGRASLRGPGYYLQCNEKKPLKGFKQSSGTVDKSFRCWVEKAWQWTVGAGQVIYCFDINQKILCIGKPKREEKNENLQLPPPAVSVQLFKCLYQVDGSKIARASSMLSQGGSTSMKAKLKDILKNNDLSYAFDITASKLCLPSAIGTTRYPAPFCPFGFSPLPSRNHLKAGIPCDSCTNLACLSLLCFLQSTVAQLSKFALDTLIGSTNGTFKIEVSLSSWR